MKKTITLLLATALFLSTLTGCMKVSENNGDNTAAQTNESTATTTSSSNTDPTPTQEPEQASPVADFKYIENNEGGISITKYIGSATNVIIPSTIDQKAVTKIDDMAFLRNETIVTVKIPDSVTYIGYLSFANATNLQAVHLSKNITTILDEAFRNCTSLSSIVLPNTLTFLGTLSFEYCKSLKHITIPPQCFSKSSATSACFSFSGLETVELSEGIETIPNALLSNTNLQEVILPSTVKTIKSYAFENCKNLKRIILNDELTKIDFRAFANTGIEEIIIPKSVTFITERTFDECSSLKKVKFEGNAPENYLYYSFEPEIQPPVQEYTVYYHIAAQGFTSPTWNGHETAVW